MENVYVNSEVNSGGFTFILPKNLLNAFVKIADLRTQIGGFIYGKSPAKSKNKKQNELNKSVKEIHCIVLVPQTGNHLSVNLANQNLEHIYLEELEPMGIIHTVVQESNQMSPYDCNLMSKFVTERKNWDIEVCSDVTVGFTMGRCTVNGYRLTPTGYDWAIQNQENNYNDLNYSEKCFEKTQVILSERILGFFLVPNDEIWNYNFIGVEPVNNMQFGLVLRNPKEFYDEFHRPSHFFDLEKALGNKIKIGDGNESESEGENAGIFDETEENSMLSQECDDENLFD